MWEILGVVKNGQIWQIETICLWLIFYPQIFPTTLLYCNSQSSVRWHCIHFSNEVLGPYNLLYDEWHVYITFLTAGITVMCVSVWWRIPSTFLITSMGKNVRTFAGINTLTSMSTLCLWYCLIRSTQYGHVHACWAKYPWTGKETIWGC